MSTKKHTPRKKLQYGFTAKIGDGFPWLNSWVDRYNGETDKINLWYSERGYCPENILNGAHNLFMSFSIDCSKNKAGSKS